MIIRGQWTPDEQVEEQLMNSQYAIGSGNGIPAPPTETARLLATKRPLLLSLLAPAVAKLPIGWKELEAPLPRLLDDNPRPMDA